MSMKYYYAKDGGLRNGFRILNRKTRKGESKDEYDLWIGTYDEINGVLREVDLHIVVNKADLKELKERIEAEGI
jgi:hypothetical protein